MIRPLTAAQTPNCNERSLRKAATCWERNRAKGTANSQKCPVLPWSGSRTRLELLRRSDWRHQIACIAQGFRSADKTAKGVGDGQPDKRPCNQYRHPPSYPGHEGTRIRCSSTDARQGHCNFMTISYSSPSVDLASSLSGEVFPLLPSVSSNLDRDPLRHVRRHDAPLGFSTSHLFAYNAIVRLSRLLARITRVVSRGYGS